MSNKPVLNGDWKDHELDHIWHHGIQAMCNGKISKYDLLTLIENDIQKIIDRMTQND